HDGRHRLGVDQVVGHEGGDVGDRHTLLHGPLHAGEADAELVLQQLTDRAHAPVAEVVDVVGRLAAELDGQQVPNDGHHVLAPQRLGVGGCADAQLLVDHESPDAGQVVATRVHEHAAEE